MSCLDKVEGALLLEERLGILNAVGQQPAQIRIDIAKELGLPPSTLNSVVSKHAEIEGNAVPFGVKAKQALFKRMAFCALKIAASLCVPEACEYK